jgi:hypothetical protein
MASTGLRARAGGLLDVVLDNYALECITPEYTQGRAMGWRREVREIIAQLEQQRARLEQVKRHGLRDALE